MAKKVILGSDIARDAFKTKVNDNFTELYDKDVAIEEQINSLVPNANIIQTDVVNDSTKIPSSAVTYVHGLEIDAINNVLSIKDYLLVSTNFHTTNISEGEYSIYSETMLNPPYAGLVVGRITIRRYNTTDFWLEFRPWNALDVYFLGYFGGAWLGWKKISPSIY